MISIHLQLCKLRTAFGRVHYHWGGKISYNLFIHLLIYQFLNMRIALMVVLPEYTMLS